MHSYDYHLVAKLPMLVCGACQNMTICQPREACHAVVDLPRLALGRQLHSQARRAIVPPTARLQEQVRSRPMNGHTHTIARMASIVRLAAMPP
jgi:hypothetical protein